VSQTAAHARVRGLDVPAWTDTPTHLEMAVIVLEFAIRRSRYRYHIRVLLIRLYRLLGASSLVLHHHNLLDPRNVQNDTISHFALDRASTFFSNQDDIQVLALELESALPAHIPSAVTRIATWYTQGDADVR
jgi:hypothetical protein